MGIKVAVANFPPEEQLHFSGQNIRDVHRQFGHAVAAPALERLAQILDSFPAEHQKLTALNRAAENLRQLEKRAADGSLVVNGINWLQRYLDAFYGYSEGTGIEKSRLALLQAEIQGGCQTIIVQDKATGEIRFTHTEEEGFYSISEMEESPFRLVGMDISGQKVLFFAYPGLCGWGPAYVLNYSKNFIQLVDDLRITQQDNCGPFWANAMAFMASDCGEINIIKELFARAKSLDGGFFNGYALNFITTNEPSVNVAQ